MQSQDLGPRKEQGREESDKEKLFKGRQICLRRAGREQEREIRLKETRGEKSTELREGATWWDHRELY